MTRPIALRGSEDHLLVGGCSYPRASEIALPHLFAVMPLEGDQTGMFQQMSSSVHEEPPDWITSISDGHVPYGQLD